jgi:hypothetical protein
LQPNIFQEAVAEAAVPYFPQIHMVFHGLPDLFRRRMRKVALILRKISRRVEART